MAKLADAKVLADLHACIDPLAQSLGLTVWGIELEHGSKTLLRIYVEREDAQPSPDGGIGADLSQCEELSRHVGLALDVEDFFPNAWVLEVSTPGLARRFFSLDQLGRFTGDFIEVRLHRASQGQKTWRGRLLRVGADSFSLQPVWITEEETVEPLDCAPLEISWENVKRCLRIALFPRPPKPGKASAKKRAEQDELQKDVHL